MPAAPFLTFLRSPTLTEARDGARQRTFLAALLRTSTGERVGVVLDLSERGAQIYSGRAPVLGDEITVQRNGLVATGTVTWVSGHTFGLTFSRALEAREIYIFIGSGRVRPDVTHTSGSGAARNPRSARSSRSERG